MINTYLFSNFIARKKIQICPACQSGNNRKGAKQIKAITKTFPDISNDTRKRQVKILENGTREISKDETREIIINFKKYGNETIYITYIAL